MPRSAVNEIPYLSSAQRAPLIVHRQQPHVSCTAQTESPPREQTFLANQANPWSVRLRRSQGHVRTLKRPHLVPRHGITVLQACDMAPGNTMAWSASRLRRRPNVSDPVPAGLTSLRCNCHEAE
ncbi:hypothetical protein ACCO45_013794 [Purpureocillium lilacinum]|uniref:Uncharacterized protein n=1 Tax=Purpureocillium lilacinum TaxID=33203 RepID=A0ACC4D7K6_PURLI